ncbi:MAG: hypothetical protein ABI783_04245, partial [Actinomycetota bacterium]
MINPGGTETWTVGLPAGHYDYVCDVHLPYRSGNGRHVGRHSLIERSELRAGPPLCGPAFNLVARITV